MRSYGRRGQGLVEFSLVSVLMFMLFSGIVELSWWFYNLTYLNNATNKAAREYIRKKNPATGLDHTAATASAAAQIALVNERGGLTISPSTPQLFDPSFNTTTSRAPGNYVRIDATIQYGSISPFRSMIYMANLGTIRSQSMMRIE